MSKYTFWYWLFLILHTPLQGFGQIPGADQPDQYLPMFQNKRIGLVVNQTSRVGTTHLVDFLLSKQIHVVCIFAPEHGFRGDYAAGEKVATFVDPQTNLTVYSLYGNSKKPSAAQMKNCDLLVYDIQDVGARFYTYLSTLHYVMEACAEQKKPLWLFDRPNPNGHYIDGPVLDTAFRSFVGMHPVPVVHGLTAGEFARMINGEGWLNKGVKCELSIVPVKKYTHQTPYALPVKPSPNLPTNGSIFLYPSLCFFEGTSYSVGRGTDYPFECVGKPGCKIGDFLFTPKHIPGIAEHPPHEGKTCTGFLLRDFGNNLAPFEKKLNLFWLLEFYRNDSNQEAFFTPFFDKLAGSNQLRKMIQEGKNEKEIRKSWEPGLLKYRKMRMRYLLYPDFTHQ